MKALNLNPQKYDIELQCIHVEPGDASSWAVGEVHFRFGETEGEVPMLASEAERIGRWFQSLARELKRRSRPPKKKPAKKADDK